MRNKSLMRQYFLMIDDKRFVDIPNTLDLFSFPILKESVGGHPSKVPLSSSGIPCVPRYRKILPSPSYSTPLAAAPLLAFPLLCACGIYFPQSLAHWNASSFHLTGETKLTETRNRQRDTTGDR